MQQVYQEQQASPSAQQQRQAAAQAAQLQEDEPASHADNEWGIEVVSDNASTTNAHSHQDSNAAVQSRPSAAQSKEAYNHVLPEGLQYSVPVSLLHAFPAMLCFVVLRCELVLICTLAFMV